MTARTASGVQPDRAATRSTCVRSSQSTTSTLSTRARQRPDSTSSGTSKTSGRGIGRAGLALGLGADQRMQDRLEARFVAGSPNDGLAHAGAVERTGRR